jgi:hypothetical protein
MPPQRIYARFHLENVGLDFCKRQTRALEQIEPHGSYAAAVELLEFHILDVRLDHHHAARAVADHVQSIEQTGIVRAVETGLHDHETLHADDWHERLILREISVR